MKEINLRELYPSIYKTDTYAEVSDDVPEAIKAQRRAEAARKRKMYRYKAHYSLDRGDGIEHDALYRPATPGEIILEKKDCAGKAVRCDHGITGETGKKAVCPFLSGHEQARDCSTGRCR